MRSRTLSSELSGTTRNKTTLVSLICSYLVPPLGIYWRFGCGSELAISMQLTLLGYLPGVIYSWIMIGLEEFNATRNHSKDL